MNAMLNNLYPLPATLEGRPSAVASRRRHHIGDYALDPNRVDRFNQLLTRLDRQRPALDRDQLASAARQLVELPGPGSMPSCIQQRLRRAAAIDLMTIDPGWTPANDAIGPAELVIGYVRSDDKLIPDTMPRIGRLDDAIVIDVAWPLLAEEVRCYLDYCRVRRIEATLRNCRGHDFGFGRDDWERAREAEAAWIRHCREVGTRSYVSPRSTALSAPIFRVH